MAARALVALAALAAAEPFVADFEDGMAPFAESSAARYDGQSASIKGGALFLEKANQMYGLAAAVEPPFALQDQLVIQYEVTLTEGLTCGGAYIKLLEAPVDPEKMDNETPYVLMFGPDKCGATDKVHFIIRQKNPVSGEWLEHHLKDAPKSKNDRDAHLYRAVVKSDDTFHIYADDEEVQAGSLMDSLEPALTPPKKIDDPDDFKPDTWVDQAKVDDPAAKKPFDWDEDAPRKIEDEAAEMPDGWLEGEPILVPDPEAAVPDDWDPEEDGAWEAPEIPNPKCEGKPGCGPWSPPMIDNPKYKGKWAPPKIDNPDYVGPWKPQKIDNPVYFEPREAAKAFGNVGAVAVEVWTTNKGVAYDSFYLGASLDEAKAAAEPYYAKKAAEKAAAEKKAEEKAAKKAEKQKGVKGMINKIPGYAKKAADAANAQPLAAVATVLVLLVTLSMIFKKKGPAPAAADEDEEEESDGDEDIESDEDEEPAPRGRKKTPKAD